MTKDEALKLALEALKQIDEAMPFPVAKLAQASIKEVLAQPEQEPVAWMNDMGTHIDLNVSGRGTPLYTHPLQRTWVGLTAKEKHEFRYSHMTTADFIDAIEAKLKDKQEIMQPVVGVGEPAHHTGA